jgi:hypothetical protein
VSFIVFQFLVTLSSFTIIKICLFHRLELPKHTSLWWHEGPLYYQKFVLTGHSANCSKQGEVVPKGAQRKFSELTAKNKR